MMEAEPNTTYDAFARNQSPSYRFFYGNTKEIITLKNQTTINPSNDLSHDILPKFIPHMHAWLHKYGKNNLLLVGSSSSISCVRAELVKEVFANKDEAYSKKEPKGLGKKFAGGILVSNGEKWSKLRKIANHTFLMENIKEMVPEMIASVETMLERWRIHVGKEIEVYQEFRLLIAEVISRTAFGSSYLEGKNIFESLMKLAVIAIRDVNKIHFPGLGNAF